jgi:hypothetical protein
VTASCCRSLNPEINVTLAVGAISEQVTVTANASLVETRAPASGRSSTTSA